MYKMPNQVTLKKFSNSELLFNDEETRTVLRFFFKSHHNIINNLTISDKVREFSQALLVEAVDASYAMGFVEAIFKAITKPSDGIKVILKKFVKKSIKHWFKHAKEDDLLKIEIYEIVRNRIALNFGRYLIMIASGLAKDTTNFSASISYA